MRRLLPLAVSLVLAGAAASAAALPQPFDPAILEVRVNDQPSGPTLVVRRDTDGTLLVRAADLAQLRVKTPVRGIVVVDGERHVRLGAELGARVEFDEASQSVRITLPPRAFVATRSSARSPDAPRVTAAELGGFANYDLYVQRADSETSLGGILDLVPDEWLEVPPGAAGVDDVREAYVAFLLARVSGDRSWLPRVSAA